eukprot:CAMPEP_0185585420 /NCGR_PEP_ID=MMETSP0434-20130131/38600_1 /TAXON_ID=626734 ORGANISM="Favella taraikaensis, Strain Fe Narragansett Bay" /NCGR_SAMPLE_ID=MMETSP0434 /ASSEMBLY_ACC=CAM_ASM_000379 /LENGTH=160 /DNA_ID=CAMNT_0028205735 /DNA_START=38 /DNA_END=520 /DNA_ORIENTATION=-
MTQTSVDVVERAELDEGDEHLTDHEGAAAAIQTHVALALLEDVLGALEGIAEGLAEPDATIELRAALEGIKRVQDATQEQTRAHRGSNTLHERATLRRWVLKACLRARPLDEIINWKLEHGSDNGGSSSELDSLVQAEAALLDIGSVEALEGRLIDSGSR